MNRQEATQKIMEAKIKKGLTWEEISKVSKNSETWGCNSVIRTSYNDTFRSRKNR